ncbi:uncharacterized protein LOC143301930 [Babylonia areolata]|uniref:uncharacterized protein LOC143301930 n=1 Tax=Babylonia areolata TaxID=304850 RepID=UPI003FD1D847
MDTLTEAPVGTHPSSPMEVVAESSSSLSLKPPIPEVSQSGTDRSKTNQSDGSSLTDQSYLIEQQTSVGPETNQSDRGTALAQKDTSSCADGENSFLAQEKRETFGHTVNGGQSSIVTEDLRNNSGGSSADHFQIFQKVSTQISDSIVHELQEQGILEQSLQVIGQLCKVTWQRSGSSVTMTCDLEELGHAQSCFKQILKEGLQNFPASLPVPLVPLTLTADSDTSSLQQVPQTAMQTARKRGRPKGSKNKATLLKEVDKDSHPVSKRRRQSGETTDSPEEDEQQQHLAQQHSLPDAVKKKTTKATNSQQEAGKAVPSQSRDSQSQSALPLGRYSGRTRGKRINFAQLNAGNLSPARQEGAAEEEAEAEAKPSQETVPEERSAGKRSRGRPRKKSPSVVVDRGKARGTGTGTQPNDVKTQEPPALSPHERTSQAPSAPSAHKTAAAAAQPSAKSPGGITLEPSAEKNGSRKMQVTFMQPDDGETRQQELPGESDAEKAATGDCSKRNLQHTTITVQRDGVHNISGAENRSGEEQEADAANARREVVWVPYVSAVRKRQSQRGVNSPSMPVIVTTPKSPPKPVSAAHPLPTFPLGNTTSTTTPPTSMQTDDTNSDHHPIEGERRTDRDIEQTPRPQSPAISRRSACARKRRRGTASFAVIPSVVFDFALDADEDGNPKQQPLQEEEEEVEAEEEAARNPATANDSHASSEAEREEEKKKKMKEKNGGDTETKKGSNAATQTHTGTGEEEKAQRFRCPVCRSVHDSYPLLRRHLSSRHPEERAGVTCDMCQVVCPSPAALTSHLDHRHGPRPQGGKAPTPAPAPAPGPALVPAAVPAAAPSGGGFRCSSCGKECVSSASLRWHRTLVHKEGRDADSGGQQARLKCGLCHYVAVDSWDMRHHRERHRDQPATCFVCAKTFGTQASLKIHMAAKHSGQSHSCPICHKTFAHLRYLRSHLQRHGGEKRHVCPTCGWRFFQTNTLRAHMDTHKPKTHRRYAFRCPHCPAAYNSQANYRDHLNKHSGERPHVCGQCGRGFSFRSMLTTHVAFVHSASRPHCCTECDKKYKTKTQLRQHLMTHTMAKTGKSPFMCTKCGRPMASKSRLRAHGKCCKGGTFVWQQRLAAGGQQARVQAVSIVAGQPVSLVDLPPGQHINVVHHGFGKDATITVIPIQNNTTATAQTPSTTTTIPGTEDHKALLALAQQQQGLGSTGRAKKMGEVDRNGTEDMEGSGTDDSHHQAIVVTSAGNCLDELRPGSQPSGSVVSGRNGSQTLDLLQLKDSQSGVMEETLASASQSQIISGTQSLISEETFQSEALLQQTAGPSHQLVLSDGFGHTQTLLLPPELVKQDVVVIETEGGHHNILDLSSVQFLQAETLLHPTDLVLEDGSKLDIDSNTVEMVQQQQQQPNKGEETLVFQNFPPTSSSQAAGSQFPVESGEGQGEGEEGGQGEATVYMCSMCDQQFGSMEDAQHHVLISHSLGPPPPPPPPPPPLAGGLDSGASVSMETQESGAVDLASEQQMA